MVATPSRQLGELEAGGTLAGGLLRSEREGAVVPVRRGCQQQDDGPFGHGGAVEFNLTGEAARLYRRRRLIAQALARSVCAMLASWPTRPPT